jgi:hypothetical protein
MPRATATGSIAPVAGYELDPPRSFTLLLESGLVRDDDE